MCVHCVLADSMWVAIYNGVGIDHHNKSKETRSSIMKGHSYS